MYVIWIKSQAYTIVEWNRFIYFSKLDFLRTLTHVGLFSSNIIQYWIASILYQLWKTFSRDTVSKFDVHVIQIIQIDERKYLL